VYIKLCTGIEQDVIYLARFLYLCRKGKNQQMQLKLIKGKKKRRYENKFGIFTKYKLFKYQTGKVGKTFRDKCPMITNTCQ